MTSFYKENAKFLLLILPSSMFWIHCKIEIHGLCISDRIGDLVGSGG